MAEIVELIKAPRNTTESGEQLAREISSQREVFCFSAYNDIAHHEYVFVTTAKTEDEYYDGYLR